jgi:predicted nucleic acid-binding protein
VAAAGRFRGRLLTTHWVLVEVADALSDPAMRGLVVALREELTADPNVEVVPPEPPLAERGWDLYTRRADKSWSLTDCISFVVMTERGLTEALTGDHHFEQAGFRVLLKE